MCVIALSPIGKSIDKSTLSDMWDTNPDGSGISFIDETKTIQTYKSMDKDDFINVALSVFDKYSVSSPILVHCRIATHGSVCLANNHPFNVDNHTVMAHNGIISCVEVPDASDISDTRMFINTWLRYLRPTWLDDPDMCEYVGEIIGWSKLAFLTTNPNLRNDYYIINEDDGTWTNGTWFSNVNHCTLSNVNYQFSYDYGTRYMDGSYISDVVSVTEHIDICLDELIQFSGFEKDQLMKLSFADISDLFECEFGMCDFTKSQWDSFVSTLFRANK